MLVKPDRNDVPMLRISMLSAFQDLMLTRIADIYEEDPSISMFDVAEASGIRFPKLIKCLSGTKLMPGECTRVLAATGVKRVRGVTYDVL